MSQSIKTQLANIDARIAKLTEQRATLVAKVEVTENLPEVGASVQFSYGRKDPVILSGTVLGVILPAEGKPGGTFIRVIAGEGVETKVVTIAPTQIVKPESLVVGEDGSAE